MRLMQVRRYASCRSIAGGLTALGLLGAGGVGTLQLEGCSSEHISESAASDGTGGAGGSSDGGSTGGFASLGGSSGEGGGAGEANATGGAAGTSGNATVVDVVLDTLTVSGVRVPLKPSFEPKKLRYSVLAQEPAETLVVTASAAEGLHISVAGISVESGVPLELPDIEPGSEFTVTVENDEAESRSYTIVYLPETFPDFQVTVHTAVADDDPIYVATRTASFFYIVKLNNDGVPLFYQRTERVPFDFKKHANGELSYAEFRAGTTGSDQIVLDSNFQEVTRLRTVGLDETNEHDFVIQPNGNFIVLAYERAYRDLTEFGGAEDQLVIDGIFQELSPERELLFQWNSWDHMVVTESRYTKDPRDYSHLNSVFVDDDGNWIISSRGMSQVLKIDRETGEVIWRLGGFQNDFDFIGDPYAGLCGQHTASLVGDGHLLVFDNGQYCAPEVPERGELTRVVEYALDERAMTAELVWSFDRPGAYTHSQGSAQRLPNGNTFIGWGMGAQLIATEVTPDKEIVFELTAESPYGGTQSYRAWRFAD